MVIVIGMRPLNLSHPCPISVGGEAGSDLGQRVSECGAWEPPVTWSVSDMQFSDAPSGLESEMWGWSTTCRGPALRVGLVLPNTVVAGLEEAFR